MPFLVPRISIIWTCERFLMAFFAGTNSLICIMVGGILDKHRSALREYYGETDEDDDVILDHLSKILATIVMLVGNVKRSTTKFLSWKN